MIERAKLKRNLANEAEKEKQKHIDKQDNI
jgi:hypothetical protein